MYTFILKFIIQRFGLDKVVKDKRKVSIAIGATLGALIGWFTQTYSLEPEFAVMITGVILAPFFYFEARHGWIGEQILFGAVSALFGAVVGGMVGNAAHIITGALTGIGLGNVAIYIIDKAGIETETN